MKTKKQQAQAQQKRALKKNRRRKEAKKRVQNRPRAGRTFRISEEQFPTAEYVFWLAHGANYIASDYSTGTWNPIFPDIYEGKLPEPEAVAQRVLAFYHIGEDVELTPIQKAVLAWTIHDREVVFIFKLACLNRLELALENEDVDIEAKVREPFVSAVWEVFETIKAQIDPQGEPDDSNEDNHPDQDPPGAALESSDSGPDSQSGGGIPGDGDRESGDSNPG